MTDSGHLSRDLGELRKGAMQRTKEKTKLSYKYKEPGQG